MTEFVARRLMMVDTQVRPQDVTKFPIIDAMLAVPRENFVLEHQREVAYSGDNIDLGDGRVLLAPRTFAKMLDALNIGPTELVLDLGAGLGYSSAVIAQMAQFVVAVEDNASMNAEAADQLAQAGADNVVLHQGALADGAAEHGPYDVVMIEGGVVDVTEKIVAQIKNGGRIAAIFIDGALGTVRLGHKAGDTIAWRFAFNADAPVLPGFKKAQAFTF
ncbi:MAG: protein-L-isoaspartate O-methyltransferase [Rhodobacteraceae bacterium]|nr:protein-L-isoaspartate O-methyltransferase [Paracoccaceae bacterium]